MEKQNYRMVLDENEMSVMKEALIAFVEGAKDSDPATLTAMGLRDKLGNTLLHASMKEREVRLVHFVENVLDGNYTLQSCKVHETYGPADILHLEIDAVVAEWA